MGRSLIVDVRKALVVGLNEVLTQDSGNSGVSCSYGWLGGSDDKRREQIYTNRPRATHQPASLKAGRTFRNERMDFDVCVWVSDPKNPADVVDDRVMELVQIVEEYVADHRVLDGSISGLNWIVASAFELENRIGATTGSVTLAQLTLTYDARLT